MYCAPTVETVGYVYILCFFNLCALAPLCQKLKINFPELIPVVNCH